MAKTLSKIIALTMLVGNGKAYAGILSTDADNVCYTTDAVDINGESIRFEHETFAYSEPVNRLTVFTNDSERRVITYIDDAGNDFDLERVVISRELETKIVVYERKNTEDMLYIEGAQKQFDAYLQRLCAIKNQQEQDKQKEKKEEGALLLQSPAK